MLNVLRDWLGNSSTSKHRRRTSNRIRLGLELLESRDLMSSSGLFGPAAPIYEVEPNNTLDVSQSLGDFSTVSTMTVQGMIGNGTSVSNDVDWYSFQLDRPAQFAVSALPPSAGAAAAPVVLSLYNNDTDHWNDPYDPLGHRLLAQTDVGTGGSPNIQETLAAGTYYIAVSGSGNRYFNPFLAGSGDAGVASAYQLQMRETDLNLNPQAGPSVISVDPGPGSASTISPLTIRVGFSGPIDPSTINPGGSVQLIYNPNGTFGDGNDQQVNLQGVSFSNAASELQIFPAAALQPGYYEIVLAGNNSAGQQVLTDLNGVPLGAPDSTSFGNDYVSTFQITGVDGLPAASGSDDTVASAHQLGVLTAGQLVQASGTIGADPYYDPNNPTLTLNPASQVDMYHFQITGPGNYAFGAEVYAGRIGSPLDAGVSLYRLDPKTGQLVFIDGNNNSRDPALSTNGMLPLYTDPLLFSGLSAGDYYVAVSSGQNTPSLLEGVAPAANGVFDPNVTHSGQVGSSTGPYVLNLFATRDNSPPRVVSTNLASNAVLAAPPTQVTVQFDKTVNLRQIFSAYNQTPINTAASVYIQGADGTKYFPRLDSYDNTTNRATFTLFDGLANGVYQLHLSGSLGLTDLGGLPLAGNDSSGDYVVSFSVAGAPRGTNGNPLLWSDQEPNDSLSQPQVLGVLFSQEFQSGITVARAASISASDTADFYRFQVLENQTYYFALSGLDPSLGVQLSLTDATGQPVVFGSVGDGTTITASLTPGIYVLQVGTWTPDQAGGIAYQVQMGLLGGMDNPPPLLTGPAPALRIQLVSSSPTQVNPIAPIRIPGGQNDGSSPISTVQPPEITISGIPNFSFLQSGMLIDLARGPIDGMNRTNTSPSVNFAGAQINIPPQRAILSEFISIWTVETDEADEGTAPNKTVNPANANQRASNESPLKLDPIPVVEERTTAPESALRDPHTIATAVAFHQNAEDEGEQTPVADSASDEAEKEASFWRSFLRLGVLQCLSISMGLFLVGNRCQKGIRLRLTKGIGLSRNEREQQAFHE